MREGENRGEASSSTSVDDAAVIIEHRVREGARLGLDPGPLDRKAVRVQAETFGQVQIRFPQVQAIDRVTGRFAKKSGLHPLYKPKIAGEIVAFNRSP
jgi:hypothetical protein